MMMRLAVAMMLAGTSATHAAKLSGPSFAIDAKTSGEIVRSAPFSTGKDGFGVVLAQDDDRSDFPETIYLRLFDGKGKPLGKKAFVGRSKPSSFPVDGTVPAGGLRLSPRKTLVAYVDWRSHSLWSIGGLFAQTMADGAPEGGERRVDASDPSKAGELGMGRLAPLSNGRALAYWTVSNPYPHYDAFGRFVTKKGEIDPIVFDFSRKGRRFVGASRYLDGFVTQQIAVDETRGTASVFARVYDSLGRPAEKEKAIDKNAPAADAPFTSAFGLDDGSIVVVRSVKKKRKFELTTQLYSGSWTAKGNAVTLASDLTRQAYSLVPVAKGGFLLGVTVADGEHGAALEFRRFGKALKQNGAVARISGVPDLDQPQVIGLETGKVLVVYTSAGRNRTGQLVKP